MTTTAIPKSVSDFLQRITDLCGTEHADWAENFNACFADTLTTTVKRHDDGTTFLLTGDIPAMWLRDSTAQLRPYLALATEDGDIASLIAGLVRQQFRYITLPMLKPTTFFVFVMAVISSFQVFDQVMLMTKGGPGRSSSVLVHYLYQNAFQYFKLGYACAIAYLLFFIVMGVTVFNMRMEKSMREIY